MSGAWWRAGLRAWVAEGLPPTLRRALRLQLALARADHRPQVLAAPVGRTALVVAPHPDDETFGCGGTLALAAAAGCVVQVVVLTDGRLGYDPAQAPAEADQRRDLETALVARRRGEAAVACAALGLPAPLHLDLPDGALGTSARPAVAGLSALLRQLRPQWLLCPHAADAHPDHLAAARWLAQAGPAAGLPAATEVWAYETWTPLTANTYVDIGSALAAKRAAIAAYASQTGVTDYPRAFEALARYRALGAGFSQGHAEAFQRTTLGDLATQTALMAGQRARLR